VLPQIYPVSLNQKRPRAQDPRITRPGPVLVVDSGLMGITRAVRSTGHLRYCRVARILFLEGQGCRLTGSFSSMMTKLYA
jgi:hypothetical protein